MSQLHLSFLLNAPLIAGFWPSLYDITLICLWWCKIRLIYHIYPTSDFWRGITLVTRAENRHEMWLLSGEARMCWFDFGQFLVSLIIVFAVKTAKVFSSVLKHRSTELKVKNSTNNPHSAHISWKHHTCDDRRQCLHFFISIRLWMFTRPDSKYLWLHTFYTGNSASLIDSLQVHVDCRLLRRLPCSLLISRQDTSPRFPHISNFSSHNTVLPLCSDLHGNTLPVLLLYNFPHIHGLICGACCVPLVIAVLAHWLVQMGSVARVKLLRWGS